MTHDLEQNFCDLPSACFIKRIFSIKKSGDIFLQAYCKTVAGVWVLSGPVYKCEDKEDELTNAIRGAQRYSVAGVPHPEQDEWKLVQRPILHSVRAKTWKSLAKDAKVVGIKIDGEKVEFSPVSNYENNGGTSISEKIIVCNLEDENLGKNLAAAFEYCS
ncbi:hypothetical protein [Pseudacidovorax sp. RU35E]|jgi:hypothetical protein|uniref:hypothetical protein n=1 Tax=Pseudacidovorax sp. RU35E TaxID=1907403 RepID=UPI00117B9423|nr:hypothetical protein [Pseudacidovorax sp. RU35E]